MSTKCYNGSLIIFELANNKTYIVTSLDMNQNRNQKIVNDYISRSKSIEEFIENMHEIDDRCMLLTNSFIPKLTNELFNSKENIATKYITNNFI